MQTTIETLPVDSLRKAAWNYKTDGTEEQIAKLAASIQRDGSAGVLAVRVIGEGQYEVMDGNHRLDAIRRCGWTQVPCENFGDISIARAVTIARRRNYTWFEDDVLSYAALMRDTVVPEIGLEELAAFMPETKQELEAQLKLLEFDWKQFDKPPSEDGHVRLVLRLTPEVAVLWEKWVERTKKTLGYESAEKSFEFAIVEALNIPEESLKV